MKPHRRTYVRCDEIVEWRESETKMIRDSAGRSCLNERIEMTT